MRTCVSFGKSMSEGLHSPGNDRALLGTPLARFRSTQNIHFWNYCQLFFCLTSHSPSVEIICFEIVLKEDNFKNITIVLFFMNAFTESVLFSYACLNSVWSRTLFHINHTFHRHLCDFFFCVSLSSIEGRKNHCRNHMNTSMFQHLA